LKRVNIFPISTSAFYNILYLIPLAQVTFLYDRFVCCSEFSTALKKWLLCIFIYYSARASEWPRAFVEYGGAINCSPSPRHTLQWKNRESQKIKPAEIGSVLLCNYVGHLGLFVSRSQGCLPRKKPTSRFAFASLLLLLLFPRLPASRFSIFICNRNFPKRKLF